MAERNCGTRKNNGLYICVGSSPFGMPVEHFLLDPMVPSELKSFRTPIVVKRRDGSRINDIIVYIGKDAYPFIPDFIEEADFLGISRRIPRTFPFERLTPYKSRMFLLHERAIPLFKYKIQAECPRKIKHTKKLNDSCVFDTWALSALEDFGAKHKVRLVDSWTAEIMIVAKSYTVHLPSSPQVNLEQRKKFKYHPGIFAAFFVGHLEYVNKEKKMPDELRKRVRGTDFDIKICDE